MDALIKNTKKSKGKRSKPSAVAKTKQEMLKSFFGKLPKIEDGLKYQKRVRNEW